MFHVLSFLKKLSRVLLSSAFFFGILIISFVPVRAETVANFGQWQNFNSFSKTAYTAGIVDSFLNPLKAHEDHEHFKEKFLSCLKEFRISVGQVVSMIDNFYLNLDNWGYSPQDAVKYQLVDGHCFQHLAEPS